MPYVIIGIITAILYMVLIAFCAKRYKKMLDTDTPWKNTFGEAFCEGADTLVEEEEFYWCTVLLVGTLWFLVPIAMILIVAHFYIRKGFGL